MTEDRQFTLQSEGKNICLTFNLPFNILLDGKMYFSFLLPEIFAFAIFSVCVQTANSLLNKQTPHICL